MTIKMALTFGHDSTTVANSHLDVHGNPFVCFITERGKEIRHKADSIILTVVESPDLGLALRSMICSVKLEASKFA